MKLISLLYSKRDLAAGLAVAVMILNGCSSKPPAAASGSAPAAEAKKAGELAQTPAASGGPAKSVFNTDENARDPFFPRAKKAVVADTTGPAPLVDIPSLLQANFQGVISGRGRAVAAINNVMLEVGSSAVIPIRAGGQDRQVAVRCREIDRDSVLLEVQGYPEPVRIARRIP